MYSHPSCLLFLFTFTAYDGLNTKQTGPDGMCIIQTVNIAAEQTHVVSHGDIEATFSVMVVGSGYRVGYAYMAGYNVKSRVPIMAETLYIVNSTVVPPVTSEGITVAISINKFAYVLKGQWTKVAYFIVYLVS